LKIEENYRGREKRDIFWRKKRKLRNKTVRIRTRMEARGGGGGFMEAACLFVHIVRDKSL
jgi:hypothetical protein